MDDVPSREELRKSKVVELRQKLSEAGLPQTGLKEELITRLIEHYEKSANGGGGSDDEASVDGDESDKSNDKSSSEPEMSPAMDSDPVVPAANITQGVSQLVQPIEPAAPVTQSEPVPPAKQLPPPPAQLPTPSAHPLGPSAHPPGPPPPAHPPGPPVQLPTPPAHPSVPPAHPPAQLPTHLPGPPVQLPTPPGPPVQLPTPPGPPAQLPGPPGPPAQLPTSPGPPAHPLGPSAHPPGPPAHPPGPPAHPPGPPAHPPGPPAHPPGPPAQLPTPPAHPPGPPAQLPTSPAHPPGPPVQLPTPAHPPGPPAHQLGPSAHPPGPPAHPPGPPAHLPGPPAHLPGPPAHLSGPPVHQSGPPGRPPGPPAHPSGPPVYPSGPPAHPSGPPAHPSGPPVHPPGPPAHPPGPPARHQPPHQPPAQQQNGSRQVTEDVSANKSHQASLGAQPSAFKPTVQNGSNDTGVSKNKKKKKRRRRRKHNQTSTVGEEANEPMDEQTDIDVEIQYVPETIETDNPNYKQFQKIFDAFKLATMSKEGDFNDDSAYPTSKGGDKKLASKDESDEEEEKEAPKVSKKKLRKLNRLTVAQLKQLVNRPDVVEMHDATAQDPKLLIHLKSTRNTVPVPRHWCFKRKYLQGKRGIEKPPFDLPEFIKSTGVMEMRQALEDKEDQKTLKQKTRERVRPKMGKLTIDYQKLHDAFFKWQTKPKMTIHGDMYYEGKEFETRLRQKKPGELSDELRRALGMPTGVGKQKFPPPWLIAMQRYGPPPSYPNLKIPGLNTPIPEGCSFGYFVGGWGKPPVDETGRPLYGDVFGLESHDLGAKEVEQDVDKEMWGELEPEEESSSEEEEEEESEEEGPGPEDIQAGLVTPSEGIATPSGLTSIPAGLETPEMIQLRKKKIEEAMEQGGDTPALYTVLPEKPAAVGGAMMGSSHVYDLAAAVPGSLRKTPASSSDGVEVALDPSELDLDAATMTARYEEQLREQQGGGIQKEDLSDMVAEHAARQKNKRKKVAADQGKATKKLKEFKF